MSAKTKPFRFFTIRQLKLLSALGFVVSCFIFSTAVIGFDDLIYPIRIDSNYVKAARTDYTNQAGNDTTELNNKFYYTPSMLGLAYKNIVLPTLPDIKTWYIEASQPDRAYTIVVLHDVGQSRINYLPFAEALVERGFNICLIDLPGHGASGGLVYSLGVREVLVVNQVIDSLSRRIQNKSIAVLGVGLSAYTAMQLHCPAVKCLILQSPAPTLHDYLAQYTHLRMGDIDQVIFPIIYRKLKREMGLNIDTVNLKKAASRITIPTMVIAGVDDQLVPPMSSYQVYSALQGDRKFYWPVKQAKHDDIEQKGGESYYSKIGVFVVRNMPKTIKKSRFKRLAFVSQP